MTDFEQLCSLDNLYQAWRKAAKGKRGKGPAAVFEFHLEQNLKQLQQELSDGTYQPGCYESFYIHEPKKRLISAAPFRDRVVHHALCRILEPRFERSFIHDSYANRIGKGTHKALDRAQYFMRKYKYVLQCDIEQFFPAIDHRLLYEILKKKIDDAGLLSLVKKILKSGRDVLSEEYTMRYFPGDDLFAPLRPRGLPIGNLTSQFWANCFLNPFDHFIKRELGCKAYLRYVDDFLLFSDNKDTLSGWRRKLKKRLQQFRLTVHSNKAQAKPCKNGATFLGFILFPTHRRLKPANGYHFRRKLKKMTKAYCEGEAEFEKISSSIQGWINHARYGDTYGLRRAVLSECPIKAPQVELCRI